MCFSNSLTSNVLYIQKLGSLRPLHIIYCAHYWSGQRVVPSLFHSHCSYFPMASMDTIKVKVILQNEKKKEVTMKYTHFGMR